MCHDSTLGKEASCFLVGGTASSRHVGAFSESAGSTLGKEASCFLVGAFSESAGSYLRKGSILLP